MILDPVFLRLDEVIEIHRDQIRRYGGHAGIRDIRLLESAVAAPQAGAHGQYAHKDIFEMAGAYLFHIIRNHPFIDGNKRAGAVAALVFLSLNEVEIDADEDDFEKMVLYAATGALNKSGIASFFRSNARRKPK